MSQQTTLSPNSGAADATSYHASPRELRRIQFSSFLGTAIEYYDFILYATAASIVFNRIFFIGLDEHVALILSFATLAAGYAARPLGGIIFGHLGDRMGRKTILVVTVLIMGIASTLMGLLPTAQQVGVLAPILLVSLRIIQGIAVGGEWGGAMLLAFESAPRKKRGFAAAFAYMGAPAGTIIGTLALSGFSLLPEEEFLSWGWRIPFIFSSVLMLLGIFIRMKVSESQVFKELAKKPAPKRVPVADLMINHPTKLLRAIGSGLSGQMAQGLMGAWAIAYAVQQAVLHQSEVLNMKALGGVFTITFVIIAARLSDRLGRRKVLIWGNIAGIALAFPVMWLLEMGSAMAFMIAIILGLSLVQGFTSGPYGAYAGELFPTHVRYSGASIGYQLAALFGAGFTPMMATALAAVGGGSLHLVAMLWIAFTAISLVSLLLSKDASKQEIHELN